MLDLNDVQEGVLNVAFRVADENGLTLIDMKDLRSLLDAIAPAGGKKVRADAEDDDFADIRKAAQSYGNVSKATIGTIQRQLLVLENQGGTKFFWRAGADAEGFHEDRQRRPGNGQHSGRRQADARWCSEPDLPIPAGVRGHQGDFLLHKHWFDVFTSPHVVLLLQILEPTDIVLYGVALDVCNRFAIEGLLLHPAIGPDSPGYRCHTRHPPRKLAAWRRRSSKTERSAA